jgi:hypothetical protein
MFIALATMLLLCWFFNRKRGFYAVMVSYFRALFFFFLFGAAVSFIQSKFRKDDIDPRLTPIVQEFFFMKNGQMGVEDGLKVRVDDLKNPSWLGVCYYRIFDREIIISKRELETKTPLQIHSTVFHEIFHCSLGLGHYPPTELGDIRGWDSLLLYLKIKSGVFVHSHLPDGCPVSIMYPYDFSDECYAKHFEEYTARPFIEGY